MHVDAICRDGLLLETLTWQAHVPLAASTEPDAVGGAELVLFSAKSTDTESAAAPAVVRLAAEMAGPGHVKHRGRGELVIAASTRSSQLAELLIAAGVPTEISNNVTGALFAKLIGNCAYNALSAISQLPYGPLSRGEGVQEVVGDVVRECLAVGAAMGVRIPGDVWAGIEAGVQAMPTQLSSTAQDLAGGRPSEIDHLNGYVVRQVEAFGAATPVNRVLHTLVKLHEDRATGRSQTSSP